MIDNPLHRIVVIESPFAGDSEHKRLAHRLYAKRALLHSICAGESPFASHMLYTQVLDDDKTEDRALGIRAGLRFYSVAKICAVYSDYGISPGMHEGIKVAREFGVLVDFRTIGR